MAFLSLTDSKLDLNITGTQDDTELSRYLTVVEAAAAEYLGGPVTTGSVVEVHHGGWESLVLRSTPVISVSTVSVTAVVVDTSSYFADTGSGVIYSRVGVIGSLPADTTVTYTAGQATIPADVLQGCYVLLRHLWETQRGSMSGRDPFNDSGAPTGMGWSLPNRVKQLWDPHRMRAV